MTLEEHKAKEVKRLTQIALSKKTNKHGVNWFSLSNRKEALGALHYIQHPNTLPALYKIAEKTEYAEVCSRALELAGFIHDTMNRTNSDYSWYEVDDD